MERQIEGHWEYTHVVTYIEKEERMHDSCRVRRGSLGTVCIGCVLSQYSGGPNDTVRRVGVDKSGGQQ